LAEELAAHGIKVWYDRWEVLVGHNLADQIFDGILNSDYLLVMLTKASVGSRWVKEELDFAKTREIESRGILIVPLLFEDCEIPPGLKSKVFADFRQSFEKGFLDLKRLLLNLRPPRNSPSVEAPIHFDELGNLFFVRNTIDAVMTSALLYDTHGRVDDRDRVRNGVDFVLELATHFELDRKYREQLDELIAIMAERESAGSSQQQSTHTFDVAWRGGHIFLGALAFALPTISKVAFEFGKGWHTFKGRMSNSKWEQIYWSTECRGAYEELMLSDRFYKLVASRASAGRIRDALALELFRYRDYQRLRNFLQRRSLSEAFYIGFLVAALASRLPNSKEDETRFTILTGYMAQSVLATTGEVEPAEALLKLGWASSKEVRTNWRSVSDGIFEDIIRPIGSAAAARESADDAKAMLLGMAIGRIMFFAIVSEPCDLESILRIESLSNDLGVEEEVREKLQGLIDSGVSRTKVSQNDFEALIETLRESFLSGRSAPPDSAD
jgi:hypothetical protein